MKTPFLLAALTLALGLSGNAAAGTGKDEMPMKDGMPVMDMPMRMMDMPMMKEHMSKMHEHMKQIKAAKSDKERMRLMQEHMEMADEHMATMGNMMSGDTGCPGKSPALLPSDPADASAEEHKKHH